MNKQDTVLEETKNILLEMSNLVKRKTGLPVNIWVDDIGVYRQVEHNELRIKVQNNTQDKRNEDTFSLSIDKYNPVILGDSQCKLNKKQLKQVQEYVCKNYEPLMKYWNQVIDIEELKDILFN